VAAGRARSDDWWQLNGGSVDQYYVPLIAISVIGGGRKGI